MDKVVPRRLLAAQPSYASGIACLGTTRCESVAKKASAYAYRLKSPRLPAWQLLVWTTVGLSSRDLRGFEGRGSDTLEGWGAVLRLFVFRAGTRG